MAHTKAGGSTRQKGNRRGKRLGVKVFGGETVKSGHIIVRQKGSKVRPGVGVKMGRDYTLYSIKDGVLKFIRRQGRQIVTVQ
ncbi:MAG: 50S ribosomal protein L27 [Candidatus Amesbacteria bacterium GW2011_GWA1_47_16]|uniref:Large ribosomal subunit protein bL27 n=5 Tax=Candidatus Amesiibacteriota TaxID=1752730 RepID=A0A1F4ZWX7_9BACT|nr:MAG: 50S ribosomal protein L27, large subunit ribosomal protein L27 [Candidatus Amesbacteria bacterium GW2011_GWC1_47_15]KKU65139.1 MAG: 50S ribosomal protein L27 [Candidatus Amesbacteria bacterium GW2011_GWA1_47_16]KKU97768.1 MAG: 50S ribosomal protein L27 [Candidatus Amesbacteria bacterium GW2011_GWB1_48_13]OGC99789.1 MAG: 50S ribosomal protein L27 [Candidatus Amesbacteria bacterium RIFCSPHIGHO2_01_FULL_47_34]OGD01205.1 MAG: 50S ribosomal protein L27 [Candidatus Amesbacteria bacterium RIFC